jgi:hypothetical protein
MSLKKTPYISSVKLARIDDSYIIPTAIFYESKKPLIGREARERCSSPELLVEDFKIELGKIDPDSTVRRSTITENTPRQTPVGLAKDFFDETIRKINTWLELQGLALPQRILVAEPLSLSGSDVADESWLANYRKSIKKALYGRFQQIDFMPEPFAVFQYYKYGVRHPAFFDPRKHVALVLDFGGGTFDASVIETTKVGEISGAGVNSRPLGAKSVQVGGYYINRLLAEDLLFLALEKRVEKSEVRKALTFFYERKNAEEEFIAQLAEPQRNFFRNMKLLLQRVETAKVSVCNSIANWSLSADLSGVAPYSISVPTNPFAATPTMASLRLDAGKLRTLYEQRIWTQKLRDTVQRTIERARGQINLQEISVVLLSGGSSNIRWLSALLERDLKKYLMNAQILELNENFQEIVAKGLATECARRFYTEGQGDFRAVTYNRLCLMLRSDDGEIESKRFRPITEALKPRGSDTADLDENVLLPSASALRSLIDEPLRWKVRLSKPPKHTLHYYFTRSSFDPDDLESRYNIVDARVPTPTGTNFQQSIEIELVVREKGTAEPRFIYGQDDRRKGTSVAGRPFYIDMTFAAEEVAGETYLGFDFGTSTSACSFVSSRDIQIIQQRSRASEWLELADLVTDLPYPAAAPLARYMSEMDQDRRMDRGREAAEALLTLGAYVLLTERCTNLRSPTNFFKGLAHRSAGPLWNLIKQGIKGNSELTFAGPLAGLMEEPNFSQIDTWISDIAKSKHGKVATIDYATFLSLLGNAIMKVFAEARLGVFEGVTAKRFGKGGFKGIFRTLMGSSQTFIHVLNYEGPSSFSDADVFLVNPRSGTALNLSPFYFWGLNMHNARDNEPDLYEFDSAKDKIFSFKAVQPREEIKITGEEGLTEIWEALATWRERDQPCEIVSGLRFNSSEVAEI